MKIGVGFSREREADVALAEAYRKSLQRVSATKADLIFVFYSYDYSLDQPAFSGSLRKVFREVPHYGCSTWSAWSNQEVLEGETGMMVVSIKAPSFEIRPLRVHSLREKAELWSAELSRQIDDSQKPPPESLLIFADSLNFTPGGGFAFLERKFPKTQILGIGTSFSVPQCSLVCQGEVYLNALVGLAIYGKQPWVALLQSIKPELAEVQINRMSENLIIEIDEKPAFYKLCEHLMSQDDLPMMSPDEFRKHMGNLYVVERSKEILSRPQTLGDPYKVISLLGSEMTTGMVAVAQTLDFSQTHLLGQKKVAYTDELAEMHLSELKSNLPKPSLILMFVNSARNHDKERVVSDLSLVRKTFPDSAVVGVASHGEFLGGANQYAAIIMAFH